MTICQLPVIVRGRKRSRRGVVLVAVLICLLCVTALMAGMTRSVLRLQRQVKTERSARQVELLLEAGWQRALHELGGDSGYAGETWRPRPGVPAQDAPSAEVTIIVERSAERPDSIVQVTAEYPAGSLHSIRRTQRFLVSANP